MHKHILVSYTLMASSLGSCTCVHVPRHMSLRLREPALPALARLSLASSSPQQPPSASCTLHSFRLMAWLGRRCGGSWLERLVFGLSQGLHSSLRILVRPRVAAKPQYLQHLAVG